jgi:hypothetical protein
VAAEELLTQTFLVLVLRVVVLVVHQVVHFPFQMVEQGLLIQAAAAVEVLAMAQVVLLAVQAALA